MGSSTRLSKKCRECPFKDKCSKKRMEIEGYIETNLAMLAAIECGAETVLPMAVKHDYRDIKIDKDTTVTIDLEELKEQMKRDFYKAVGLGIDYGA